MRTQKFNGSRWKEKQRPRKNRAMSLIEMVTALFIMTFVAAAMTELCVSNNVVAFRTFSRLDGLIKTRRAMTAIDKDIRMASFFPNSYAPTGGYPGDNGIAVWPIPTPSYITSNQTLIVQVPEFDANDYPTGQNKTVVYCVLADKRAPGKGQFVLQRKDFSNSSEPQTILTGIVGPIDSISSSDPVALTPPPVVFTRLTRTAPLYSTSGTSDNILASLTNGIACCLEIHEANSSREDLTPKTIAIRREIYARGNYSVNQ